MSKRHNALRRRPSLQRANDIKRKTLILTVNTATPQLPGLGDIKRRANLTRSLRCVVLVL